MNSDAIQEELDRLATSRQLTRSKRLLRFLRFTVEWALTRGGEPLTEYTIGTKVYDRDQNFDPLTDGIVRAEAHRLRAKLRDYYSEEGKQNSVTIEFPVGSYVPVFRTAAPEFLPNTGKMADAIRSHDWTVSGLGPIVFWPQTLKTCLSVHLRVALPVAICWGPDLILLFNDAMFNLAGGDPLDRLGRPLPEAESANWRQLRQVLDRVREKGESVSWEKTRRFHRRDNYFQETYFNASFSPIIETDGQPGGVLIVASDVTAEVLAARRNITLLDLSATIHQRFTVEDACRDTIRILEQNPYDIPFGSLYLMDTARTRAEFRGSAGIRPGTPLSPEVIPLVGEDVPLTGAISSGRPELLEIGTEITGLPKGAWDIAPRQIVVLPLRSPWEGGHMGALILGVNPHRLPDPEYRDFFEMLARRVAILILRAIRAEELHRAVAAAEENERTWAAFADFSEEGFRTPLTVILGMLDQVLADQELVQRDKLVIARRNALRLLNFSGGLTDLVRLQRGGVQASYEPMDLGTVTGELAGLFASALGRPNLSFVNKCKSLSEPAYVDRRMWEKLILALLLNAAQLTETGEIGISVRTEGAWVETVVWDTGPGIPESERAHIFEPFHVDETSYAGERQRISLGLSLVQKFANMHGGHVRMESEIGKGTKIVVSIPLGSSHLPAEQVSEISQVRTGIGPLQSYIAETLHWTREQSLTANEPSIASAAKTSSGWQQRDLVRRGRRKILVAQPDSDLRQYLVNLASEMYNVESVADGGSALRSLRENPPDLLLADSDLGDLDGLSLVRTVRGDMALGSMPVVLISANSSEEDRLRSFAAGANDFLVKPFTGPELLVRLESQIALAATHDRIAENEKAGALRLKLRRALLDEALEGIPLGVAVVEAPSGDLVAMNRAMKNLFGGALDNFTRLQDVPEGFGHRLDGTILGWADCPLVRSAQVGEAVTDEIIVYDLPAGRVILSVTATPILDPNGRRIGAFATYRKATAPPLEARSATFRQLP